MRMQEVEVAADIDFGEVAAMCDGYSGDDVTSICRDAAMNGMRTLIAGKTPDQIRCRHLLCRMPECLPLAVDSCAKVSQKELHTEISICAFSGLRKLLTFKLKITHGFALCPCKCCLMVQGNEAGGCEPACEHGGFSAGKCLSHALAVLFICFTAGH